MAMGSWFWHDWGSLRFLAITYLLRTVMGKQRTPGDWWKVRAHKYVGGRLVSDPRVYHDLGVRRKAHHFVTPS